MDIVTLEGLSDHALREHVSRLALAGVIPLHVQKVMALSWPDRPDPLDLESPSAYLATFQPRAWVDEDNIVDLEAIEHRRWIVSERAISAALERYRIDLEQLLDETGPSTASEAREMLLHDSLAPLWIRAWQGPYAITLQDTTGWRRCDACKKPQRPAGKPYYTHCWSCGQVEHSDTKA